MYTQIWNKYMPVIRILLKKTAMADQTLNLNASDFKNAGAVRKSGYKFDLELAYGRIANLVNLAPMGKDFADSLLADKSMSELIGNNRFTVRMDSKFQLFLHREPKEEQPVTEDVNESEAS